jgi:hypothetical protein
MLDMSQFEQQIAQAEARIQALGQQTQAVQAQANAAQAAASQAQSVASQATGAASAAAGTVASSGIFGGFGGGGTVGGNTLNLIEEGGSGLVRDIRRAGDPKGPGGSGWTLGEDLGASWHLVRNMAGGVAGAARSVASAFTGGFSKGIDDTKGDMSASMRRAINETFEAAEKEAEIGSPSRRAAREIGNPIMEGVGMGIVTGTAGVTAAMMSSLHFAFNNWKAGLFGGTHVGAGLNVVANPGGMLGGGLGGFLGMLGGSVQNSFDIAQPTSGAMSSRVLMSNVPMPIRDFGQNLISGLVGSILPGWAAGPLSDMLGTMFGTKPVLQAEAVTAPGQMAGQGGFRDYPYGGGNIFNTTNYFQGGNFTEVERQVQIGILQSARRLGVPF